MGEEAKRVRAAILFPVVVYQCVIHVILLLARHIIYICVLCM